MAGNLGANFTYMVAVVLTKFLCKSLVDNCVGAVFRHTRPGLYLLGQAPAGVQLN